MADKIEIVFLGSGSAVPTSKKNHPGILLRYKEENILFDCGEGIQRQFRNAKLNPCKLTKLFITHWHGDHVLGIPGLLMTIALNGYNRKLQVYGPKDTKEYFGKMMNLFVSNFKVDAVVDEIGRGKIYENEDYIIESEEMLHGTRCLAYSFRLKDKLRIDKKKIEKFKLENSPLIKNLKDGKDIIVKGKKIKYKDVTYLEKGKKVTIILDSLYNSEMKKIAKDSDILIIESTYLDEEDLAKEHKHMTLKQAISVAKEANVKKLVLMHLSQKYDGNEKDFEKEAKKMFKESYLAFDFMKLEL